MTYKPEIVLFLSDARGIYIPRDFATSIKRECVSGVSAEQWAILEQGPDSPSNESYWDVWNEVTDSAIVTDDNGIRYSVWQDGDCWLIPEGMEWNDEEACYQWPSDDSEDDSEEESAST